MIGPDYQLQCDCGGMAVRNCGGHRDRCTHNSNTHITPEETSPMYGKPGSDIFMCEQCFQRHGKKYQLETGKPPKARRVR